MSSTKLYYSFHLSLVIVLSVSSTFIAALLVEFGLPSVQANIVVRLGGALLALTLLARLFLSKQRVTIHYVSIGILVLIVCLIMRVSFDHGTIGKLSSSAGPEYLYYLIIGSLIPVFVISLFRDLDATLITNFLIGVALILGVTYVLKFSFLLSTDFGRLSRELFEINPLTVGYTGALLINLLAAKFISSSNRSIFTMLLFLGGVLVGIYCLAISGSRGPLVNVFVILLILAWCRSSGGWTTKISAILASTGVILSTIYVINGTGSSAIARLMNTGQRMESEAEPRVEILRRTLSVIPDNLWLGYGVEAPGAQYPHNLFLDVYLALGVIGGTLFVGLYFAAVIKSLSEIRKGKDVTISVLFLMFALWGMVSSNIYYLTPFWSLLAVIFSISPCPTAGRRSALLPPEHFEMRTLRSL